MKVALLLIVSLLASCATTSTIHTLDGYPVEAEILYSDQQSLHLAAGIPKIDRDQVTDIDYPGNVHLVVGASLGGVGVLQAVVGAVLLVEGEPMDVVAPQVGTAAMFLVAGGALSWWGYKTYSGAKRATVPGATPVNPQKTPEPSGIVLLPTISRAKNRTVGGLSISGSF